MPALPTLGTALIEVLDALNPIVGPGVLDLTPNQATIHCVVWAGGKVGADGGVAEASGFPLALAQQYPIRQLTTREISNSGGLYEHGDIIIENIPPAYSDAITGRSGGYTLLQLSPRSTSNGIDVYYEITGTHSGFYKVVELRTDDRLAWRVVLTRTATRPMITTPALSITVGSVSPNFGSAAGGTVLTITGTGFLNASTVSIGGTPASSVVIVSDTTITCATAASTAATGLTVTLTASGGVFGAKTGAFTYLPAGYIEMLRADTGVTLNGSTISAWADQSGAGHNGAQPSAPAQPTLVANALNTRPVARFSGSQGMPLGVWQVGTTQCTIFFVLNAASLGTKTALAKASSQTDWEFTGDGGGLLRWAVSSGGGTKAVSNGSLDGAAHVICGRYNSASAPVTTVLEVDGVAQTTTGNFVGPIPNGPDQVAIGAYCSALAGLVNNMTGDVPEFLVWPTELSVSDRGVVRAYLKSEYGTP